MNLNDYKQQEKEAIIERATDEYGVCKCEICGETIDGGGDFAHMLGNTKTNLKIYGVDLCCNRWNGKLTHPNALGYSCNAKADIGHSKSNKIREHVDYVIKKMAEQ